MNRMNHLFYFSLIQLEHEQDESFIHFSLIQLEHEQDESFILLLLDPTWTWSKLILFIFYTSIVNILSGWVQVSFFGLLQVLKY